MLHSQELPFPVLSQEPNPSADRWIHSSVDGIYLWAKIIFMEKQHTKNSAFQKLQTPELLPLQEPEPSLVMESELCQPFLLQAVEEEESKFYSHWNDLYLWPLLLLQPIGSGLWNSLGGWILVEFCILRPVAGGKKSRILISRFWKYPGKKYHKRCWEEKWPVPVWNYPVVVMERKKFPLKCSLPHQLIVLCGLWNESFRVVLTSLQSSLFFSPAWLFQFCCCCCCCFDFFLFWNLAEQVCQVLAGWIFPEGIRSDACQECEGECSTRLHPERAQTLQSWPGESKRSSVLSVQLVDHQRKNGRNSPFLWNQ